ncbi:MAG TPA: RHS repeat-associated core domain-containing protein [Acidimicrobiales bacterium]|jgi:RHS repeat-associated protein
MDGANALLEVTYGLPGGAMLTTRSGGNVWSYPNIHGDIVAIANQAGAKQGATLGYDPYGNQITGTTPDNSAGNMDYGWLGGSKRPVEHEAGLQPTIEMGARQYSPQLGRFLEVDPVEGGSANDYDYVAGDPVNAFDLNGTRCTKSWKCKASKTLIRSKKQSQRARQEALNKLIAKRNRILQKGFDKGFYGGHLAMKQVFDMDRYLMKHYGIIPAGQNVLSYQVANQDGPRPGWKECKQGAVGGGISGIWGGYVGVVVGGASGCLGTAIANKFE